MRIFLFFFSIVEFSDRRALDYAIDNLNGSELDGSKITIIAETIGKSYFYFKILPLEDNDREIS